MRFMAKGPDIPSELLDARDEGKVVFFCGAGVSFAKARLPNFQQLTAKVTAQLGVMEDDPAMILLNEATATYERTGISGLIPADRIFGLLAQEFDEALIENAVIKALAPKSNVDLSAHQVLLSLATTSAGQTKLVTTNFDRLFCQSSPNIPTHHPKHLSKSWTTSQLNGVVYLHGCADKQYKHTEKDGFVLTSASFGRAYLSEGWATEFIQTILQDHHIVFVGYSADDPPVQYLLEALNQSTPSFGKMYVFHPGTIDDGEKKWLSRGVKPIVYSDEDGHHALWATLQGWQTRAKDPEQWMADVVKRYTDPTVLEPYQRGQVAHIVSSVKGAEIFTATRPLPSIQWLRVFEPAERYGKPAFDLSKGESKLATDPFEKYGLDCDEVPQAVEIAQYHRDREPATAFNVFDYQSGDVIDQLAITSLVFESVALQKLPQRLEALGYWISQSAWQTATLQWAVNKVGLHPIIIGMILRNFSVRGANAEPFVERAWHYLFDCWAQQQCKDNWGEFNELVAKHGVTDWVLRKRAKMLRPFIKAKQSYNAILGRTDTIDSLHSLIGLSVEYTMPYSDSNWNVSNKMLPRYLDLLCENLRTAVWLSQEIGLQYKLHSFCSIWPDDDKELSRHSLGRGLNGFVRYFVSQFEALVKIDLPSAKNMYRRWQTYTDGLFIRLLIWAGSKFEFDSGAVYGEWICNLSETAFWCDHHRRDLLLSLQAKWSAIPVAIQVRVCTRIFEGPQDSNADDEDQYQEYRAECILDMLYWLQSNQCKVPIDLASVTKPLKQLVPDWTEAGVGAVVRSHGVRSLPLGDDTDYSELLGVADKDILTKASDLECQTRQAPFRGLCGAEPEKALRALFCGAEQGYFPADRWQDFLWVIRDAEVEEQVHLNLLDFLLQNITKIQDCVFEAFANWLQQQVTFLAQSVHIKLATAIKLMVKQLLAGKESEESWASVSSIICKMIVNDRKDGQDTYLFDLLNGLLSNGFKVEVLGIIGSHIDVLYEVNPQWTKTNILGLIEQPDSPNTGADSAIFTGIIRRTKIDETFAIKLVPWIGKIAIAHESYEEYERENATRFL
ncbi:MAG: SIR2 family protein, partial [Psychrosphaera sp.]|nr:SIR2 family protein [Psychrosphaera sp.]